MRKPKNIELQGLKENAVRTNKGGGRIVQIKYQKSVLTCQNEFRWKQMKENPRNDD